MSQDSPAATQPRPRVVVVRTAAEAAPHADAWRDLAAHSLDDNVYVTPEFLIPVLEHLKPDLRVALVYATLEGRERLVACAAFGRFGALGRLPFPGYTSSAVPHGYVGLPLIDRRFDRPGAALLQDWLDEQSRTHPITAWGRIPCRSATWDLLADELARRDRSVWKRSEFERPALTQGFTFDERIAALSKSRRKSYRRNRKKLEAMGDVRVNVHRDLAEAPDLAARFMDLEGGGWKGDRGTALASDPDSAAFFTAATAALAEQGRILFVELQVDRRPVALTANFIHGTTMFAFKVAFANDLAHVSPGILVEMETLRAFQRSPDLRIGESGTGPDSYLASYWRETAPLAELVTAARGTLADRALRLMPMVTSLRRSAAEILSA